MSRGGCVLMVDDDPAIRDIIGTVPEDEGARVETATNGREAQAKARDHAPDVILLDLVMPVLDGAGFLRACRAGPAFCAVPVLLMSAGDLPVHAEALGAQGLLVKPFDFDLALAMLAGVL